MLMGPKFSAAGDVLYAIDVGLAGPRTVAWSVLEWTRRPDLDLPGHLVVADRRGRLIYANGKDLVVRTSAAEESHVTLDRVPPVDGRIAPDGERLAVIRRDKRVTWIDIASGRSTTTDVVIGDPSVRTTEGTGPDRIAFLDDGSLAAIDRDGRVQVLRTTLPSDPNALQEWLHHHAPRVTDGVALTQLLPREE
jgi:hypothetical protein